MALYTQERNWLRLTADKYPQPYEAYSALRPPQRPLWLNYTGIAAGHTALLTGSESVASSGSGLTTAPRRLAEFAKASIHFSDQDEWTHVHHILTEAIPSPVIDREDFVWEKNFISGRVSDDLSPSHSLMFANMGGGCDDHLRMVQESPTSSSYLCLIGVRSEPELFSPGTRNVVRALHRAIKSWPGLELA